MAIQCDESRSRMVAAILGKLPIEEERALESHIDQCGPCAAEQKIYKETLRHLQSLSDEPVPRHFFVYPQEGRAHPSTWFRSPTWRTAAGIGAVAAAVLLILTILDIRRDAGGLTLRLGNPDTSHQQPAVSGQELSSLRSELLEAVEARSRADRAEILRTLKEEITRSESQLSRKQRSLLQAALARVDARLNQQIVENVSLLASRTDQSLASLYRVMESRHSEDLAAIEGRLNQMAADGEIRRSQTDTILDTLIQVAALRLR